jgi:hypothetical protein
MASLLHPAKLVPSLLSVCSVLSELAEPSQRGKGAAASPWLNHVMEIFALFMLCSVFTSLLIPETKRKTLEELAGEVPGTPECNMATITSSTARAADSLYNKNPVEVRALGP